MLSAGQLSSVSIAKIKFDTLPYAHIFNVKTATKDIKVFETGMEDIISIC